MANVIPLLTKQYAVCVYIFGTRKFVTVPPEYHEPVKRFAADNYSYAQLDNALVKDFITEQEYQETIAYIAV